MKVRRLHDGSTLYVGSRGVMQGHELGNGVLLHVRRGIMDEEFASLAKEDCERQIRDFGRCVLLVDGHETKMHTTEFREVMTDWFRLHEHATVHMLVSSAMVQMALNVSNLVMGSARANVYFEVTEWEAACRQEAPSFSRRPLAPIQDLEPHGE